jgi:hypothetical protein
MSAAPPMQREAVLLPVITVGTVLAMGGAFMSRVIARLRLLMLLRLTASDE